MGVPLLERSRELGGGTDRNLLPSGRRGRQCAEIEHQLRQLRDVVTSGADGGGTPRHAAGGRAAGTGVVLGLGAGSGVSGVELTCSGTRTGTDSENELLPTSPTTAGAIATTTAAE